MAHKIDLLHPLLLTLALPFLLNAPALPSVLQIPGSSPLAIGTAVVFLAYLFLRLSLFPYRDSHGVGIRIRIMMGGRKLVYTALWAAALQLIIVLLVYPLLRKTGADTKLLGGNTIFACVLILLLAGNGLFRMFFTSRRLSIVWRLILLGTFWIPLFNLLPLLAACRMVYEEYDFACHKKDLHLTRVDSDICKTQYPLIMVHGVLFRDLRYFNYWGRIPRHLIRYGATIFHGNQGAVSTIEDSAAEIRDRIHEVLKTTGCEKVNIIAHSKGGLDARYAITELELENQVASLTTICTPHRGCRFIDFACNMPEPLYRRISNLVNGIFSRLGDKHADCYTAIRQFRTSFCRDFNERYPNSPKVYYQSYMTKMHTPCSDTLLAVPYAIIKALDGENDGLVATYSAKWGEFRGMLVSQKRRGISHGDIIDLKREDYRGFDVLEAYVGIVTDLKQKGF